MILVDTSVWIDHFRKGEPTARLAAKLASLGAARYASALEFQLKAGR